MLESNNILYAGCIYRSPSSNPYHSVTNLCHLLETVNATNPSHLLIAGDFNLPQIDWRLNLCNASESHYASQFFSTIQDLFLFQHVTEPTRFREGTSPSLLDLILTNEEGMVVSVDHCPGLGKSDHVILKCILSCYSKISKKERMRWNFNRADFHQLTRLISDTDWERLSELNVEAGYQWFKDKLFSLMHQCIPLTRSSNARKNLYMTRQAMRLKRQKLSYWSAFTSSQDEIDLARFKRCRNRLRGLARQLRRNHEAQLISNIKTNPKAFWKYSNSRSKVKPRIGDLRDSYGSLVSHDQAKATVLNEFFASVFTTENLETVPELTMTYDVPKLSDVAISAEAVQHKLLSLKSSSAQGPDEIHPRMLKELNSSLACPLALLYRRSLDTGILPTEWKQGMVVPIFKKGDKQNPENYRPVSLTSVPCKVLESLIRDELMDHLASNGLLSDAQHGFRPRRSCTTQLLETIDNWSRMIDQKTPVDVVYLDFRKAFDSVPHRRLLSKLRSYGISGRLLTWIEAFLSDRSQQVALNGCRSNLVPVASGVPQGSVLGPVLFLLYINDLPDVVTSQIKMFADDAKVFSSIADPTAAVGMQADLDALVAWSDTWQMTFNEDKCKVMHIGPRNCAYSYHMRGHHLDSTQVEKDLGIQIDHLLKFRQQAAAAVAKANRMLAIIRRSFATINEETLPLLYKSLVRPHLEYGSLVWGPFNRADEKAVERVQRRATRLVISIRHLDYQSRLRILKLPSLYYRRRRGDMINMYQMLRGGVDVDAAGLLTLNSAGRTRGHSMKLRKPRGSSRIRQNSFAIRAVNEWNGLPDTVVNSPSVSSFKSRLDAHWEADWYWINDTD